MQRAANVGAPVKNACHNLADALFCEGTTAWLTQWRLDQVCRWAASSLAWVWSHPIMWCAGNGRAVSQTQFMVLHVGLIGCLSSRCCDGEN